VVVGTYDVDVNAMDYMGSYTSVDVPDDSTVVHDIELIPWDLPEDCLLYGWVNDTVSGTGISSAQIAVQLSSGDYYNQIWSESDGYYEMYIPQILLDARVTAWAHEAAFETFDAEGETDIRMDFSLAPDLYAPNLTYSQDPVYNISALNPSVIDIEVEDLNLREMTLRLAMYWKTVGDLEYYYILVYASTSFDAFNPSDSLPYTNVGDTYFVSEVWDGTASAGWLGNDTLESYIMAYEFEAGEDTLYGVRGYYSNDVLTEIPCTAIFDGDTGEVMFFQLEWGYGQEDAGDETGLFAPVLLSQEYDLTNWNYPYENYNEKLDPWSVVGLRFYAQSEVPSGDYRIFFSASDFGYLSDWVITNLTVDNDPPIADAGTYDDVSLGATTILDGSGSSDNVGIVDYVWTFTDGDEEIELTGVTVDYVFGSPGVYTVTLTVSDAAGNSDVDTVEITVVDDEAPVADAGADVTIIAGGSVSFDGGDSTDNVAIVEYMWTFTDDGEDMELTGETIDYVFENAGTYTVLLTVEDAAGLTDQDTVVITVEENEEAPVADAGTDQTVTVGDTVTFDGSGSSDDVDVVNYTWTFTYDDEAKTLYGEAPTFDFDIVGTYEVTLTVTDAEGLTDTDTVSIVVEDEVPTDDEPKSFIESYGLILGALAAIAVIGAAAVMLMRRG
ncbi:MAG: PKD domain-containing protein, partial [Thermoplasmata archaeon]|nr:PKD domain-containing protein [Thermoplasmata archaeon]